MKFFLSVISIVLLTASVVSASAAYIVEPDRITCPPCVYDHVKQAAIEEFNVCNAYRCVGN